MKQLVYLALLTMIPAIVFGQKSFDDEVNSELDKMYEQNKPAQAAPAPVIAQQTLPQAQPQYQQYVPAQPAVQAQPVQQPTYAQAQPMMIPAQAQIQLQPMPVQKQPTTMIEASPLTESRAEKMRKAREEAELQTEQKIVEKLETSRMEDEKKRSEVLFGDKFNQLNNPQPTAPAPVVAAPVAATPVVVQEQAVVAPQVKGLDREAVHNEITAALDEAKAKEEAKKSEKKTYFSLMGGMDQYNNTNVKPQYSMGIGVGQKINDRMLIEGQFIYSDAHIQQVYGGAVGYDGTLYPRISDMQQYQGIVQAKYELLGGVFRPVVGAAAAYTYRKYSDIQFGNANDTGTSNAIDVGFVAGADVTVNENFAIGFEAMYLWNIANQTQADNSLTPAYSTGNQQTPENMGNLNLSLVGRMSF